MPSMVTENEYLIYLIGLVVCVVIGVIAGVVALLRQTFTRKNRNQHD